MGPIVNQDIESELSYALLHAIAAKAGAACVNASRLSDNRGIDAHLTYWENDPTALRQEVDLKIQLKATIKPPADNGTHYSYSLKNEHYNDLRAEALTTPRVLIVLFLPQSHDHWLTITETEITMRRAAYWVSLRGAEPPTGQSTTVYVPKSQLLTSDSLKTLFKSLAQNQTPLYSGLT